MGTSPKVTFSQNQYLIGLTAILSVLAGGFYYIVHTMYEELRQDSQKGVEAGIALQTFLSQNLPKIEKSIDQFDVSTSRLDTAVGRLEVKTSRLDESYSSLATSMHNDLVENGKNMNETVIQMKNDLNTRLDDMISQFRDMENTNEKMEEKISALETNFQWIEYYIKGRKGEITPSYSRPRKIGSVGRMGDDMMLNRHSGPSYVGRTERHEHRRSE